MAVGRCYWLSRDRSQIAGLGHSYTINPLLPTRMPPILFVGSGSVPLPQKVFWSSVWLNYVIFDELCSGTSIAQYTRRCEPNAQFSQRTVPFAATQ